LCVMEIAIRIWNPPIAQPEMRQIYKASSEFGWELIPGSSGFGVFGEYYQINAAGFRGKEVSLEKSEGVNRIVVLGDSFTFGMGVNQEHTYPEKLERLLNNCGFNCEVFNFGVIGYNMWQYLGILKTKILPLKPDMVILGLFADDIPASVPPDQKSGLYSKRNVFEKEGVSGILAHSSLLNLLQNVIALFEHKYRYKSGHNYVKAIQDRKKLWGPDNPSNSNYKVMSGKIDQSILKGFSDALKQFVADCKMAGADVLIVMIPDSVQLGDLKMQAVNRFVKTVCSRIGVSFTDVTPCLESEKDYEALYLFPFDAHNSPRGLRIIAQSIADKITVSNRLHKSRL